MLRRLLWALAIYLLGFIFVWSGILAGFTWAGPPHWSAAKRVVFATEGDVARFCIAAPI
jgi:hypothetical protein